MASPTTYVELQVTSHFSFLRGASSPDELFSAAALLGHRALGIADLGSVAGLVRAWAAQKATGVRLIAGARVVLEVPGPLLRLARGLPVEVLAEGSPLPRFDLHCPLLSLPRAFGTLPDSVPPAPYLAPAPEDVALA